MDSTAIIRAARALGLRLTVTKDDGLLCEPASLLTPELREAIRANRGDLLYDVLLADARRYLGERDVEGSNLSALADLELEELDLARLRGDWPAYRAAIRGYVQVGLREIERAKRARPTAEDSSALGDTQREAGRPERDRCASDFGVPSRRREHGVREPAVAES